MRAFGLGRARALDNGYCALGHGLVGLGRGRARALDNGYCALGHGLGHAWEVPAPEKSSADMLLTRFLMNPENK
jgi:hypothetical protein